MATASMPRTELTIVPTLANQQPTKRNRGYRLMTFGERLHARLFGCIRHRFTSPRGLLRDSEIIPPAPYDSYQACVKCGCERFYKFETDGRMEMVKAGPIFIRTKVR